MLDADYQFTARLWRWKSAKSSWHFFTLPTDIGQQIRGFQSKQVGFGSVPVSVTIGETHWKTSLFPDKKAGSYVLPIKAAVRKAEHLKEEGEYAVKIELSIL